MLYIKSPCQNIIRHHEIKSVLTINTRNSSGDEIANVNIIYDDIIHTLQNTVDSSINEILQETTMFIPHHYLCTPVEVSYELLVSDVPLITWEQKICL